MMSAFAKTGIDPKISTKKHWDSIGFHHHHGIALPLSALHSSTSAGIGEFYDLIPMIEWCSTVGLSLLQLLPLNDSGFDASPYNALSSCALNPIYLSFSELFTDKELQDLRKYHSSEKVHYKQVYEKKRTLLQKYLQKNQESIASTKGFKKFLEDNNWVVGYALFVTLKEKEEGKDWRQWQGAYRDIQSDAIDDAIEEYQMEIEGQIVIQYLCHQQCKKVAEYARKKGVHLMGDIPILLSPDSADVWLCPAYFSLQEGAGAPPDAYANEGQAWGFPLYQWDEIANDHYSFWKQRLSVAEQYYTLYRLDHVVGFYRIWAVPHGEKAISGHFIPQDQNSWTEHGETILQQLLQSCSMLPVGEDLGDIPDQVRESLQNLGIPGMKVLRWERDWNGSGDAIATDEYSPISLSCVSTHDSETLADWWISHPQEAKKSCEENGWDYQKTPSSLNLKNLLYQSHHSGSYLHCNLLGEYLALHDTLHNNDPKKDRINTPNTVSDENWTLRYIPSVEQICNHTPLANTIRSLLQ